MNLSFKNTTEEISNNNGNQYIRPGIHEVTIKEIYYQPIGANVKEGQKPETVSIEKAVFVLTDKTGASFNYDILSPKDAEQATKMLKRLMHFLSKTGKSVDADSIKNKLIAMPEMSFEDMIKGFSKHFTGKSVRVKFGTDEDRKYTRVPSFFNGWAECIDVTPSQLRFDESKDTLLAKDSTKVEAAAGDSKELDWLA